METAAGTWPELRIFGDDYPTRDGTCIRDYVHVSDLARAHALALTYLQEKDKSLTLNLGSEKGISVKEMLEAAHRITGKPIPAETDGRRGEGEGAFGVEGGMQRYGYPYFVELEYL